MKNKEKKIVVFSPYFGKLPIWFNLWLKSCSYNERFTFIVFTDDKYIGDVPKNVIIKYMKFQKFRAKIQNKFKFEISLETPYKLCDYKPIYGYVFDEYLNNALYWGYCDMDLIFGDLNKFLPDTDYDKISFLGHFCLYKNTKEINTLFMQKVDNTINYQDVLSNAQHFGFDEIGNYGINNIFKINSKSIYNYEVNVADINCRTNAMEVVEFKNGNSILHKEKRIFEFNNGKIISHYIDGRFLKEKEYAYIHFQKRKMLVSEEVNYCSDKYLIVYDGFKIYNNLNKDIVLKYQPKKELFPKTKLKLLQRSVKNRIKRKITIYRLLNKKEN